ncbi:MAG TPA: nucleoside hydrolase, partial [Dongiaceae bacterium]|nr:nucleoside hydrolase [Dongiaceae bacterium]
PADVMVLPGADRPLQRALLTAKETHGAEGIGDHTAERAPQVHPSGSALRDALRAAREPVTLVTLGPLTNLASALRLDPSFVKSRVQKHVMMGGSLKAQGTMGPHAEFNVWCDPEAAEIVFAAGLRTEMVGLDVTRQLVVPARAVHALATHADPDARWLGRLLGFYVRFHQEYEGLAGAVINDPLAVALAVAPELGETDACPVRVDRSDGPQRGRTTVGDKAGGDPVLRAYRSFDRERVHALLIEHLFGPWLSPADLAT